jgi:hypothetical protein
MTCNTVSKISYGCCDLSDYNQTMAWVRNSPIGHLYDKCHDDVCPTPTAEELPASGEWTSPVVDGAGWYDVDDSRSEHFLGVTVWKDPIFSTSLVRDSQDFIDGSVLGVPRLKAVEAVFSVMLWVDDCCAVPFAKAWLTTQLRCASDELPFSGCSKPTLTWYECQSNGCDDLTNAFRSLANVGVTNIEFEPVTGFQGCCIGVEATITFKSESPYTYNFCETQVLTDEIVVDYTPCEDCALIMLPPERICRFQDCQCGGSTSTCNSCSVLKPVSLGAVSDCYCAPAYFWRRCWSIPPTGGLSEQVLKVVLFGGKNGLKNVRLTGHNNPNDSDVSLDFWRCTKPCVDLGISEIQPYETLIIDSARQTVIGNCGGGTFSDASDRVSDIGRTGSRFFEMDCNPIRFCIEVSSQNVCADDATINVFSSTKELR